MFKGGGSPPERWSNHGATFQGFWFFLKKLKDTKQGRVFFYFERVSGWKSFVRILHL